MRSFCVKTDLLRILLRVVETTLPRIRSASLGKTPRDSSSAEARISFIGTSLGTKAKFWADSDAFHFSFTITDADIFALFKPQLKDTTVSM